MTLNQAIFGAAPPQRLALVDATQAVRYGDLPGLVAARAVRLSRVRCAALALDNGVDWVLWDLAAVRAGTVLVPLPPFFTAAQRANALSDAGCDLLIGSGGLVALPHGPADLPEGTAKITYTSGTTGNPRGVCLSAEAMARVAAGIVERLGPTLAGGVHVAVMPLAVLLENVAGVHAALLAGSTVRLPSLADFGAGHGDLHAVLRREAAQSAILVPDLLRLLIGQVRAAGALSDLRFLAVGGSRVAPDLIAGARALGLPAYEGYGLSECASVVTLNTPGASRAGTVGQVLPHVRLRIEAGEIVIMDPGFLGHVGAPHRGALATGDLGAVDADGFVTISGRKRNVIITTQGRNIAPEWVESVLMLQPEIAQAVVWGEARAHLGALIVPSAPGADIAAAVERANASLPDYAQIRETRAHPPFTLANGQLTGTGRPRRDNILASIEKETPMAFFDHLVAETETVRQALYAVLQLVDGLRGEISRTTYVAYLTEAYHHVSHTTRFLAAMRAALPAEKRWLEPAIDEYIAEETGHEAWILNDIAAAGGDAAAARAARPNLETEVMIAYNYDYIARRNPVGFLGMVFMLESTSTQIASHGADAVRRKLDLPEAAFSYLYSHGALDIEHMKFLQETVNRVTDPADQAAIVEVARDTFRLFANLMRAIPHDKARRDAA